MRMVILDPELRRRIIRRRQRNGADRFDEVWNGVYVMSPIADNEHQKLAGAITSVFYESLRGDDRFLVYPAVNVSDREDNWRKNYRCPDAVVFLKGNPARDRKSHWLGGPDFVVEVISPYDRSRKKHDFYASVGVRELLLIDRNPWSLELYRLRDGKLELVGKSTAEAGEILTSDVLPLSLRLVPQPEATRPPIEITRNADAQRWLL